MKHLPLTLIAGLLATFRATANPNEAPDILPLVESALGNGYRVVELTITDEDLQRDGLDASYYGEFAASLSLPVALFHEVSRGDGYILVGKLLERGETISGFGNAVAAYQDGRWLIDVNVLDLRLPGGSPFSEFRTPGVVVLEAGANHVDRFLAQREAALKDAEALRLHSVRLEDAELRLEDKLRHERKVLAAQRKAAAEAAAEAAEIEARRGIAEERAAMVAAHEASLTASDEMIFPLLGKRSEHPVKVTHEGRRVEGTLRITENGASHASGTLSLALGNGEFHQTFIAITAADEPGQVVGRYPWFGGFQRAQQQECLSKGVFSAEHRLISIEGNPTRLCKTDRIVIDLSSDQ